MRGKVRESASPSTIGVILGDDARLYRYTPDDLRGAEPEPGQEVLFDIASDHARNVHVVVVPDEIMRLRQRDWIAFYLSPRGRISRKDYWLYGVLVICLVQIVIDLLTWGGGIPIVAAMLSLVFGWAGVALAFKRFQDRGLSGWWCLLPYALMAAAFALALPGAIWLAETVPGSALTRIGFLLGIGAVFSGFWAYLWVPLLRGERGYNRFGPDPLSVAR